MADKETASQCEKEKVVEAVSAKDKTGAVGKECSPKSSPSKIETNEALQHLVQGKRHLLVRDVNSAVNSLQEACRLLAEQYGETADPCGEAYFFYGKALLELSRMETGVLGNALDGVPEGDDADTSQTEDPEKLSEEEKMKVVEEVDEALEENFNTLEKCEKSRKGGSKDGMGVQQVAVESGQQSAETEMEAEEKTEMVVGNEEEMETGGEDETGTVLDSTEDSDSVKKTADGGEVAEKTETEPAFEEMEVDGAALSTVCADATTATDSAASDEKGRPPSETVEVAVEAKEAVEGAGGDGTDQAEEVLIADDSVTAEKGDKVEDQPVNVDGQTVDAKSEKMESDQAEGADKHSKKTAESVMQDSAMDGSGGILAKEAAEDSSTVKDSGAVPVEKNSSEEPIEASKDFAAEKVSEESLAEKTTDVPVAEKDPDAAPAAEKVSETVAADKSENPSEIAADDKSSENPSETVVNDKSSENPSEAVADKSENPSETVVDKSSENPSETAVDKSSEDPSETVVDKSSENPSETVSADKSSKNPSETVVDDKPSDACTAETTEKAEEPPSGKKPGESTEGDEEDGDEAEGDEQPAEAEDAAAKEGAEADGETKEGDSDTAEGEDGDDAKEGDTSQDCDTEEGDVEGDGEGDGAKEGEDEEDVPNIQLAWEVLELAKVIFTRQAKDKASDLKLSEVYQKLGEVSIEAENYSQAVDDLNNCLTIQKKHLEADDRLIAETHYHLGVAHSLANQYSEAIEKFQASVDTILARVQRLQRQILDREQGKKIEHEDPFYKEENEIKELEDLLPDMKEKIADMRDMKSEAQKKIAEIFAASGGAGPSTSAAPISPVKAMMTSRPATSAAEGDSEKETHSISHLVKRKRLSNEPTDEEAKRAKQNGHNGVNGHAES